MPPVPPRPMPAAGSIKVDPRIVENLRNLRDDYKKAALLGKQADDRETAVHCYKVAKSLDESIAAYQAGKSVDMSNLPPRPNFEALEQAEQLPSSSASQKAPERVEKEVFKAPAAPTNVMEALQQRLEKYKSAVAQSREEGNEAKVRRMLRIQQVS